jgi:hypothetical protein
MVSLNDFAVINADWLATNVRETRNTRELVKHLRAGGPVTPDLAALIADLLEGEVRASFKPLTFADIPRYWIEANLNYFKAVLRGDMGVEQWEALVPILKEAGFEPEPKTKGQLTKAALYLTQRAFRLTPSQLNELLSPRKARQKNR